MNNITYTRHNDYYLPDIRLSDTTPYTMGKYGRMRKSYLREHRTALWNVMILSESLFPHLIEIDETANRRLEQLITDLLTAAPAPDKATRQMEWVQHMNMLKAQAEEIIFDELIYN